MKGSTISLEEFDTYSSFSSCPEQLYLSGISTNLSLKQAKWTNKDNKKINETQVCHF